MSVFDLSGPGVVEGEEALRTRTSTVCQLRTLERIAARCRRAGISLMALKGAALKLTVYDRPDLRPMADVDLLVQPEQVRDAVAALRELGCREGRSLVRSDFFPRFHYEAEFLAGGIFPTRIDLHVRPFRPLRYAGCVPRDAFWKGAQQVRVGRAQVLVPAPEDMLIHLAAHCAIHGQPRNVWLEDIKLWADVYRDRIDWDRFVDHTRAWGLVLPVRQAVEHAERDHGRVCPVDARRRLARARVGWRDRLALRQAPRDADHPAAHVLVNALCTPNPRFVMGYLAAVLVPDRRHMAEWYRRRHRGWLICAHALRVAVPALRWARELGRRIGSGGRALRPRDRRTTGHTSRQRGKSRALDPAKELKGRTPALPGVTAA